MTKHDTGKVNIHGKEYKTVALRVAEFREKYPFEKGWAIITELVSADAEYVIMRAAIVKEAKELASGYAEEKRGSTNINRTSALENAETSAIGRALAAAGFAGTEYASADEVAQAITQQREPSELDTLIAWGRKFRAKVDEAGLGTLWDGAASTKNIKELTMLKENVRKKAQAEK